MKKNFDKSRKKSSNNKSVKDNFWFSLKNLPDKVFGKSSSYGICGKSLFEIKFHVFTHENCNLLMTIAKKLCEFNRKLNEISSAK